VSDQRVAPAKSVVAVMSHVRLPNPDPQIGRSHPDRGRNARHSVYRASGLVLWHESDVRACPLYVRYRGQPGHSADGVEGPRLTHLCHRQPNFAVMHHAAFPTTRSLQRHGHPAGENRCKIHALVVELRATGRRKRESIRRGACTFASLVQTPYLDRFSITLHRNGT